MILERGGVCFVLFGITGFDSNDCAPNSGMILEDPAATAQKTPSSYGKIKFVPMRC